MLLKGRVIILSAPSGAGKTTIVKHLLSEDLGLEFSISACSRDKRPGEMDGKDYYFLGIDRFNKKIEEGAFIEWEEVYEGNYYGTLKSEIDRIWSKGKHVLFEVDVKGGLNIKKIFGNKALSIFIKPPSVEELKKRLENRSTETLEVIAKRLNRAEEELSFADKFDIVIVNDDLETAKKEVVAIVKEFVGCK